MSRNQRVAKAVVIAISAGLLGVPGTAVAAPAPGGGPVPTATRVLNATNQAQTQWYYCSAAAARMAISVSSNSPPSQDQLARELALGAPGEWGLENPDLLTKVLNTHIPGAGYKFYYATSASSFGSDVFQSINRNRAVLINVTRIGPNGPWVGHWATVVGYSNYGAKLLVYDPWYGSSSRSLWLSATEVYNGLKVANNRRYVAPAM